MNQQAMAGNGDATFTLEQVQLQFQVKNNIKRLLVSNNRLCLIIDDGLVHRINLDNPEKVDEIHLELGGAKVKTAFMDSKGYHLIVQSTQDTFYYINYQSTKYRELSKLRGLDVSGISFLDEHVHSNTTGPAVVSLLSGTLYELNIESSKERLFKPIWKARAGITGVCSAPVASTPGHASYKVVCGLTNNKLVQFTCKLATTVPKSSSQMLLKSFKKDPASFNFNSLIHMSSNMGKVAFLDMSPEDNSYQITYGDIKFKSKKELDHFKLDSGTGASIDSILLTKYYILLLTTHNQLLIYNQLNGQQVSTQQLPSQQSCGFCADQLIETYWLYSPDSIYEIVVDNESSGVWQIMMERKMFDQAVSTLKSPHGSDSGKYDIIMINKGKYLLKRGSYEQAAQILARTSEPLEETALTFMDAEQPKSLRIYLLNKLRVLPKSLHMQRIIISSWLVELYMEGLNKLDVKVDSQTLKDGEQSNIDNKAAEEKEKFLREFYSFLHEFKDVVDKETVYQIIMAHNRQQELLHFANLINDYTFVLHYYLNQQKWEESLKVLSLQKDPNLVYRCSMVLFVNYPTKTCDTWIRLIDELDYHKLLSAVLTYNKNVATSKGIEPQHNQALRFLNFLIQERKCKDKLIHNSLLTILISHPDQNEDLILNYLEGQRRSRNVFSESSDEYEILFDPDYILRLCFKYGKIQSAIYVYSMIQDYEEAVDIALRNDLIERAVVVADRPLESPPEERKKLWIKIAAKLFSQVLNNDNYIEEHKAMFELAGVKSSGNKIGDVLKFLMSKCDLLTMKDLLPLFPDFVVIDNFKKEIVDSLQQFSADMASLSLQMSDSIDQSNKISKQIKDFKGETFQIIEPYESCMICQKILTTRKFIVFPCYHSFHQDCLATAIMESNDYKLKTELYSLQKRIAQAKGDKQKLTELKEESSTVLSKKCPLCTDIKINEIEQPLVTPGDPEEQDWDV